VGGLSHRPIHPAFSSALPFHLSSIRHGLLNVWYRTFVDGLPHCDGRLWRALIAKFHYTDPTRTRPDPHGLFCGEIPLGPCGSGRVRVVEFSYNDWLFGSKAPDYWRWMMMISYGDVATNIFSPTTSRRKILYRPRGPQTWSIQFLLGPTIWHDQMSPA